MEGDIKKIKNDIIQRGENSLIVETDKGDENKQWWRCFLLFFIFIFARISEKNNEMSRYPFFQLNLTKVTATLLRFQPAHQSLSLQDWESVASRE